MSKNVSDQIVEMLVEAGVEGILALSFLIELTIRLIINRKVTKSHPELNIQIKTKGLGNTWLLNKNVTQCISK